MLNIKFLSAFLSILFFLSLGCDDLLNIDATDTSTSSNSPTMAQKMRGIWIIGGASDTSGFGIYTEIDLYDPMTDVWYPDIAANASGTYTPSVFSMAASVNGKIYVLGGAVNSTTTTSSVFEYNIENNSWTACTGITSSGSSMSLMASAVYSNNSKIFLLGGTTGTTTAGVQTVQLEYNPDVGAGGTWSNRSAVYLPASVARSSMVAVNIGGIAYNAGGRVLLGTASAVNDAYVYSTNTFTAQTETAITARGGAAVASYNGSNGTYIFIIGGATSFSVPAGYFTSNPVYIASTSSFQIYTPPHTTGSGIYSGKFHPAFSGTTITGLVFAGAEVSEYNGNSIIDPTLYVFGGLKNQTIVTDEVWAISANDTTGGYPTATWASKTVMPRARVGHCVVTIQQ